MNSRQTSDYRAYLASGEWHLLKLRLFKERGRRCEKCKTTDGRLDVHHLRYDRLGREELKDLQILCRRCHEVADQQRAADTAYKRGLDTYARKKYGDDGGWPDNIDEEFSRWRARKGGRGYY